ncbi:hypothetical protein HDV05_004252 [Chytridiales sp. JEL 0842]|nr:hypothetical protein HDV05_004252 [Chytridiales sp. JEL 0842]
MNNSSYPPPPASNRPFASSLASSHPLPSAALQLLQSKHSLPALNPAWISKVLASIPPNQSNQQIADAIFNAFLLSKLQDSVLSHAIWPSMDEAMQKGEVTVQPPQRVGGMRGGVVLEVRRVVDVGVSAWSMLDKIKELKAQSEIPASLRFATRGGTNNARAIQNNALKPSDILAQLPKSMLQIHLSDSASTTAPCVFLSNPPIGFSITTVPGSKVLLNLPVVLKRGVVFLDRPSAQIQFLGGPQETPEACIQRLEKDLEGWVGLRKGMVEQGGYPPNQQGLGEMNDVEEKEWNGGGNTVFGATRGKGARGRGGANAGRGARGGGAGSKKAAPRSGTTFVDDEEDPDAMFDRFMSASGAPPPPSRSRPGAAKFSHTEEEDPDDLFDKFMNESRAHGAAAPTPGPRPAVSHSFTNNNNNDDNDNNNNRNDINNNLQPPSPTFSDAEDPDIDYDTLFAQIPPAPPHQNTFAQQQQQPPFNIDDEDDVIMLDDNRHSFEGGLRRKERSESMDRVEEQQKIVRKLKVFQEESMDEDERVLMEMERMQERPVGGGREKTVKEEEVVILVDSPRVLGVESGLGLHGGGLRPLPPG